MKFSKILAVSGIVGALVFAGCEKAPQVEIDAAKKAVSEAEGVAAVYATEQLNTAKTALDGALAAVKAEDAKMIRNYADAKKKLAAATAAATEAVTAAATNKENMKTEVTGAITQAKAAVEETKKAAKEPKNKKMAKEIEKCAVSADSSVVKAEAAFAAGDYAAAKIDATAALDKINAGKASMEKPVAKKEAAPAAKHHKK
jgi:hypothetical protein